MVENKEAWDNSYDSTMHTCGCTGNTLDALIGDFPETESNPQRIQKYEVWYRHVPSQPARKIDVEVNTYGISSLLEFRKKLNQVLRENIPRAYVVSCYRKRERHPKFRF